VTRSVFLKPSVSGRNDDVGVLDGARDQLGKPTHIYWPTSKI
jgi:hypothetical protein